MKQVTMESVQQRIRDLQHADDVFGLGMCSEFELACLRELVAVTEQVRLLTEQRDAVVAENAMLNEKMDKLATWPGIEFYSSAWEFTNSDGNEALEYMCDTQTPATSSAADALRAEGIEQWIASRNGAWNGTTKQAEEFARQLRESKGAQS